MIAAHIALHILKYWRENWIDEEKNDLTRIDDGQLLDMSKWSRILIIQQIKQKDDPNKILLELSNRWTKFNVRLWIGANNVRNSEMLFIEKGRNKLEFIRQNKEQNDITYFAIFEDFGSFHRIRFGQ